jgi:peptidoglycan/LPS O-acetylase OafA/YrhL
MAEALPVTPDRVSGHDRITVLDSLRGLAALIVVLSHIDHTVDENGQLPIIGHLLHSTILHVVIDGRASVLLFFILSGFALSLSMNERFRYRTYVIKRGCRLIIPYVAAILLSTAICLAVSPVAIPQLSGWFNENIWYPKLTGREVWMNLAATGRLHDMLLDSGLWSLVVEMRIAPFFPMLHSVVRRRPWTAAVVATASYVFCRVLLIRSGNFYPLFNRNVADALEILGYYAPLFVIGILMRHHFKALRQYLDRFSRRLTIAGGLAVMAGAAWLASHWEEEKIIAGMVLIMLACVCVPDLGRAFSIKPLAWLGRISYSLYLVHLPVLGAVFHLFYGKANNYLLALAVLVISLLMAETVYRLAEAPSIQLGRRLTASKKAPLPVAA